MKNALNLNRNNNSPSENPPSPNSVCSAGSQNGNNGVICNQLESKTLNSCNITNSQQNELPILREIYSKAKSYILINDFNIRSQFCWDFNERYINEDQQLIGLLKIYNL